MNKVYSLRYSDVAQGFIAVSEFARKCVHKPFRRLSFPVVLLSPVLFSAGNLAGTVNNELEYQLFRDFAENKGMFRPGQRISPFIISRESLSVRWIKRLCRISALWIRKSVWRH